MADLNHIALFKQVVDAGSLAEAARQLGIPKATMSRNISRLESELDTRLLNRTSRRVELTSQGRTYYDSYWVVFGRSLRRAVVRLDGPEGRHEIQTRGRLSVDGAYAALLGVQAGLGLGLLPRGLIRGAVERGDLLHLLPQYEHRIGGLFAVYPSQRHQSAASRALLDFVIEQTR